MSTISLPSTVCFSRVQQDASLIPGLTADQQERLTQVLDEFLRRLEAGEKPNSDELAAAHPDLAEHLRRYIESLRSLQDAAGGFGMPIDFANARDGQRLGDFRLIREIGRGGMAVVYEASQVSIGRLVALKVLPIAAMLDGKQLARFRNEALALGQLEHPHIVPIYAVGEDRGTHFFAMRLIEGIALDGVIDALGDRKFVPEPTSSAAVALAQLSTRHPLWFQQVARLVVPIAKALHAAHELGIVHRDIKPSNLLIDRGGKPWVADFGLARWQTETALTRTGEIVGTVRYMSPEQARGGSVPVDHRTDVYSLGITLYELVTLHRAFDRADGPHLLAQIQNEGPPPPHRFTPDIPAALENVILKAIAPSRDDRYATAQEFADDLERFLAGKRTVARSVTLSERFGKFIRRRRQAAISVAAGMVLLTVASLVATGLIYQEKIKKDAALADSNRNYQKVREVLDRFGAQLADQLESVPGAEDVRRSLLLSTIDYYRDFIRQSGSNDGLRNELATALNKIALLTEHVGTDDEALACHEGARSAFEQLAKDEPEHIGHLANLALCENNLGLLLGRMGRADEAENRFRQAIERERRVIAMRASEPRFGRDLALMLNNLGLLLGDQGRRDDAARAYQAAIELHEQLARNNAWAKSADGQLANRYLAATHANIAALQEERTPEAGRRSYVRSVSILRSLVEHFPGQSDLLCDLALTFNNFGAMQSRLNEHMAAAESYREAINLLQSLVAASPTSIPFRRDLSLSLNNRGLALARDGRSADAELAFRQAAEIRQVLVSEHPDSVHDVTSLGGIWNNLGMMLEGQQQPDRALTAYAQALKIQRGNVTQESMLPRSRDYLDRTLVNFIRLSRGQGQLDQALKLAQQRRDLWSDQPERLWSAAIDFAEIARQDAKSSGNFSETHRVALRQAAEAFRSSLRCGFSRSAAAESAIFQELFKDEQFRAMLGWSDWQSVNSH